ncbi:MAG: hypothetical protein HP497_12550 [Nitrospira sp.]|nr:hypothetical protein [Nitrospira sp.]
MIAQFCGAFNDNAWKLMVALLAIRQVTAAIGPSGPEFEAASQTQATIAFVVFNLPLMLFSIVAGVLSDRLSKRTVIITFKMVEIALMGAGALALWRDPTGGWPALAAARSSVRPNTAFCLSCFHTNSSRSAMGC